MPFTQCTSCGICCEKIYLVHRLNSPFNIFPYKINNDGSCSMLDKDRRCKVYNKRPDICNVDRMFDLVYSKEGRTIKDHYKKTVRACNKLMRMYGINSKYYIEEGIS